MLHLDNRALDSLASNTEVDVPKYDRADVKVGIVHFGVGGFHRSHQAMYLDTLMGKDPGALNWGVCGVGLMENDKRMQHVLDNQNGLYTLVQKGADGSLSARVIGVLREYLYAPDSPSNVIDRMTDPAIKIVSLTITEGGYNFDPTTCEFDFDNPEIINDLHGFPQRTTFGLICSALDARRQAGLPPFTIMSCDNMHNNGEMARITFLAFARRKSPELADWIEKEVQFPNSMVDRITPATNDEDRALVRDTFGIDDAWPVVCEPFVQWVVEDRFPEGRPALEKVGVQFVDDVSPYEKMKLRLLNNGHLALSYLGYLCGYQYAHEAAHDPLFIRFLETFMEDESTPTLEPVPGVNLEAYRKELIERFGNAHIRDTLARLCAEGSEKLPKWLVPVIRDRLSVDGDITLSATVTAAWARYAEGIDEKGQPIDVVDRQKDQVMALAAHNQSNPDIFIGNRHWFGELASHSSFRAPYEKALDLLHKKGARATMEAMLASKPVAAETVSSK